jgi:hypothetical protein
MAKANKALYPRHPVAFIGILCSYRLPEAEGEERGHPQFQGETMSGPFRGKI